MILICYGTRPEWIKVKPVIEAFKNNLEFKVLFTGQHEHIGKFYHDYNIMIKSGKSRLNSIISSILEFEPEELPEYVLIQGDTATTFAMALWAYNKGVKILYLEAGLRTYDLENPYPEESYRQMISRISTINFCVTENNEKNLEQEKCAGINYVVGNTVLDNLKDHTTSYSDEILITLHRRENQSIMQKWFKEINNLSKLYPHLKFTIPLHPNPNIQQHKHILTNINVINPLDYEDMIKKISSCRLIISDSGGIQEEASFFNKKVIVCRKETERQESLGTHSFLCKEPSELKDMFVGMIEDYKVNCPCPYGDGTTSNKILKILLDMRNENK